MTDEHLNNRDSDNWDDRVLCQDESCTGTIGSNGRCRVCGLTPDGETTGPTAFAEANEAPISSADEDDTLEVMPDDLDEEFDDDDIDDESTWEDRILCRDESCIGTIGPDGRCSECGLTYEDEEPSDPDEDG